MSESSYVTTVSPHLHQKGQTISRGMRDVLIALSPAAVWAVIVFGLQALLLMAVSVLTAMLTELLMRWILGRSSSLGDLSAVVTGLLFSFLLPVTTPLWVAAIGAFIAIAVAKELFGGLGKNYMNPAFFARFILMISPLWLYITKCVKPFWYTAKGANFFLPVTTTIDHNAAGSVVYKTFAGTALPDVVTSATPLSLLKSGKMLANGITGATPVGATWTNNAGEPNFWSQLLGLKSGCIGEVSCLLLLIGGLYLIYRKTIDWRIPTGILGGALLVFLLTWNHPLYQMFAGGLWLGAFFMATDWVTSPMSHRGKWIYGIGIGVTIAAIRIVSFLPEGVAIAILIWNILTPLIDRYVAVAPFGSVGRSWFNKLPVFRKPAQATTAKTEPGEA